MTSHGRSDSVIIWTNDDEFSIPITVPSSVTWEELGAESRCAEPRSLVDNIRTLYFSVLPRQLFACKMLQLLLLLAEGLVLAYPGTIGVLSASDPQACAFEAQR